MSLDLPLLLEPLELQRLAPDPQLLIVDLSAQKIHAQYHLPGAVHLEYGLITAMHRPVMGLLPAPEQLERVLSALGIGPDTHVVAYDEEGGGKACRLLWTLDTLGHHAYSLLNGGLHSWANERLPLVSQSSVAQSGQFRARPSDEPVADRAFILQHLGDPHYALLDARSPAEYSGLKNYAARGGHIPGAVNFDWMNAIDQHNALRLRPAAQMREALHDLGIHEEQCVINYCQTHHRSSLTYFLLKWLGFKHVKGYPGSWSDWGNQPDTPVET